MNEGMRPKPGPRRGNPWWDAVLPALYFLVIAVMAAATIIEKSMGTHWVGARIYGSWWFAFLWALLALLGIRHMVRRRMGNPITLMLHASLAVILLGALLTRLTARQGTVRLPLGEDVTTYQGNDGGTGKLPFSITLESFDIRYHEGTTAEAGYESTLTIRDARGETRGKVSMNRIFSHGSYRLCQAGYGAGGRVSTLSVNSDPWGIPVTYAGYALLFLSLVLTLLDPRGGYRKVLRSPALRKGVLSLLGIFLAAGGARAATVLPRETAERFGRINILYNNRVCPLQTFAIDFTRKLCGKASYKGYTPEQVLTGFIFWGDEWSDEPIMRVKGADLRERLSLPGRASVNDFFGHGPYGYILGPLVQEYHHGARDAVHKQAADVDDRLRLVMELRRGIPLKVFPHAGGKGLAWYSPTDVIDDSGMGDDERAFIRDVFSLMYGDALTGNFSGIDEILENVGKYQERNAGESLPSSLGTWAERTYNGLPIATMLFMLNLTMGFLSLLVAIWKLAGTKAAGGKARVADAVALGAFILSFLALTLCIALRWAIRGSVPMANGYEAMLLMAWFIMAVSLLAYVRFRIIVTFGFLMSGFFLLVSHLGQMDPAITHVAPVLDSPLLGAHVSMVMMAFALLSLTFICGVMALALNWAGRKDRRRADAQMEALKALSGLFQYPALAALGIGIFIGAIWANVSWGTYWSWDAKEVWGLITFMVYAVPFHGDSLPFLRRPVAFHAYMVLAFLTILMTYFGVNHFLGGMHSYA